MIKLPKLNFNLNRRFDTNLKDVAGLMDATVPTRYEGTAPPQRAKVKEESLRTVRRAPKLQFEDLSSRFHLTLASAAKDFGVSITYLKKVCRTYNIKRWPFRKVYFPDAS